MGLGYGQDFGFNDLPGAPGYRMEESGIKSVQAQLSPLYRTLANELKKAENLINGKYNSSTERQIALGGVDYIIRNVQKKAEEQGLSGRLKRRLDNVILDIIGPLGNFSRGIYDDKMIH